MMDTATLLDAIARRRNQLRARGYLPIPCYGKTPALKEWQKIDRVTPEMIEMWRKVLPTATDTGALTRSMPSIDLDILREDAAVAAEEMINEKFGERGWFLVRIGRAPKRLIPFRLSSAPFEKLTINFEGERGEKIELLSSGQQAVLDGVHVETKRRYVWHGGEPWQIDRCPYREPHPASEQTANRVMFVPDDRFSHVAGMCADQALPIEGTA